MTDSTLNRFIAQGTAAQRASFTPSPPTPGSGPAYGYYWYETDTGLLWAWYTGSSAWVQLNTPIFYGSGAPSTLHYEGAVYADDSTTPYGLYVQHSSAWHAAGGSGGGGSAVTLNPQTGTSYTLALTDAQAMVTMTNSAANTLTVPPNSSVAFPIGSTVAVQQTGAGKTTVAAGSGVTINYLSTLTLAIVGQYGVAQLIKTGTDTWTLFGAIGG